MAAFGTMVLWILPFAGASMRPQHACGLNSVFIAATILPMSISPGGDACYGPEGSGSKSFKDIITIKGDKEVEQRGSERGETKWKDGVNVCRGVEKSL